MERQSTEEGLQVHVAGRVTTEPGTREPGEAVRPRISGGAKGGRSRQAEVEHGDQRPEVETRDPLAW